MSTILGRDNGEARRHEMRAYWERQVTQPMTFMAPGYPLRHEAARASEEQVGASSTTASGRRVTQVLVGLWSLRFALACYIVLNLGDVLSTYVGLHAGLREGNPLMSGLLAQRGFAALIVYKILVVLVVGSGVLFLKRSHPRVATGTLILCNALVGFAVAMNLLQVLVLR